MKRVVALIAAVIICASFLIVPASAEEVTVEGFVGYREFTSAGQSGDTKVSSFFTVPYYSTDSLITRKSGHGITIVNLDTAASSKYSGTVGIYASFYVTSPYQMTLTNDPWFHLYAEDELERSRQVGVADVTWSDAIPVVNAPYTSALYRVSAKATADEGFPITALSLRSGGTWGFWVEETFNNANYMSVYFPSVRVVGTATSAELGALEDMASEIAEQNEILNAMYGDIIEICNSIYSVTGDLLAAQNLSNQYFSQIIPILNSMNTTTNNIYSLLQTQFSLLLAAIERESGNLQDVIIDESGNVQTVLRTESEAIQDAIDQAVVDLIAYFDSVFKDAIGDLPSDNADAEEVITGFGQSEGMLFEYIFDSFPDVVPTEPAFDSQLIAGFALINSIFTSLWIALGNFQFIYIFPLSLALVLLSIGRLSKFSGVGSRGGGPRKSPSKGGSDDA